MSKAFARLVIFLMVVGGWSAQAAGPGAHDEGEEKGEEKVTYSVSQPPGSSSSAPRFARLKCSPSSVTGIDSDGDGIPDSRDDDDDCDYLADDTEIDIIGTSPKVADTESDGIIDGRDVAPLGTLVLTVVLQSFDSLTDMDCCPFSKTRFGDPYLHAFEVRLARHTPVIAEIKAMPGFNEKDHPHDVTSFKPSENALGQAAKMALNLEGIDDIAVYPSVDAIGTPLLHFRVHVKDHDVRWDDDYDIDGEGGHQPFVWSDPRLVWLAEPSSALVFEGYGPHAGKLVIGVSVNTTPCAVLAASKVRGGAATVYPQDIDCPPLRPDTEAPDAQPPPPPSVGYGY